MKTPCQDPIFIGGTLYANVDYKTVQLSNVSSIKHRADGRTELLTGNGTYIADFSSGRVRDCFMVQLKERE